MFTKSSRKNNSSFAGFFLCLFLFFLSNFSFGQQPDDLIDTLILRRLNSLQTTIPLPYNNIVEDCIKHIARKDKKETQKLLERVLPNKTFFQNELLKAGLPQEFACLPFVLQKIQQENKGAFYTAGVWGLPLFTAVKYGLTVNNKIDERYCVEKSTTAAIAYLQDIYKKQKNSWETIIAYSNSLSALEAAKIRTNHSEDIWILYEEGHLPNKNCIPYFIAYTYLANFYKEEQLKVYPPANSENLYLTIHVKKEVDIQNFITFLEIGKEEFEAVNPAFIGNVLIPNFDILILPSKYDLFVQKENSLYLYNDSIKKPDSLDKKSSIPNIETNTPVYHTVKSGDMLGRIAQKYEITVEQLKIWNNLSNDIIQPGQQLIVNMSIKPSNTNKNNPPPAAKKEIYTVKSGDTLGSIARKYNVSVSNLKKWNNLKNDIIGINQKIVILK